MMLSNLLLAASFTITSYNCGGLPDHYDYIRAACMQKILSERQQLEPAQLADFEELQKNFLVLRFSSDPAEQKKASEGNYSSVWSSLISHPESEDSPHRAWKEKSDALVSPYNVRPIAINDPLLQDLLACELKTKRQGIAKKIFHEKIQSDIIALQEADYVNQELFPDTYEVRFSPTYHSVVGLAWKTDKFSLVKSLGIIGGRGFALLLEEVETKQTVLVATAHLSGCNPFKMTKDEKTGELDCLQGDLELKAILKHLDDTPADTQVLAMDANVTAAHPRLDLLKEAGYVLDYKNHLEPTCTNPWQLVNTRIDWIAVKAASIENLPVLGIDLNCPETNMSDHKPIASRITAHPPE